MDTYKQIEEQQENLMKEFECLGPEMQEKIMKLVEEILMNRA